MDLTRPVNYRGFKLNGPLEYDANTHDLKGCQITSVQYGQVLGVGYDEKRALDEGRDASDVFLDQRLIALSGTLYGRNKAEAFDLFREFSEVMSPSAAYRDDPSHRGYSALTFWMPTDERYPSNHPQAGQPIWDNPAHPGLIPKMLQARPMATPSALFNTDRHGGGDNEALAIPWSAQLACKDPRMTNTEAKIINVDGAYNGSGTLRNWGNVPAVLDIYLTLPPRINGTGTSTFELTIEGVNHFIFTLPRSANSATLRYSSDQKTVAYKSPASGTQQAVLAMNRLALKPASAPLRHIERGEHTYDWHVRPYAGKTLKASSYISFRDTWI